MKNKNLLRSISVLIIICFVASVGLDSLAVTTSDKTTLQNQINQAKNELNDISSDKEEATTELDKINSQVVDAENQLEELKNQISDINDQISEKEDEISQEEKDIEAKNELLKERMVALYEAGDTSYIDVLLNSEDLLDFISGYSAIQTIVEADTNLINELESQKDKLEQDKSSLETDKQKVEELKKEQEIKNGTLVSLQDTKKKEIAKLSNEEKTKQSEIDTYNAAMKKVNEELAEMARKAEEALKKQQGSSSSGSSSYSGLDGLKFDGSFIWPCNNKTVTSTVKWRWGRMHKGIDIAASYESVYAAASGYAFNAYDSDGYGNYIMIFHGSGYVSLYGHLSSSKVSDGTFVKQGQTIAISGNTGGSQGPHLHFELRQASSVAQFFSKDPLNPLDYLPGGYTLAAGATATS